MPFEVHEKSAKLSLWSGEYADRAAEHAYRAANRDITRKQTLVLGVLVLLVGWPIILTDYATINSFEYIDLFTLIRMPAICSLTIALIFMGQNTAYRHFDILSGIFSVYMIFDTYIMMYVMKSNFEIIMPRVVLFILILNILVSLPVRYRLSTNALAMTLSVSAIWMYPVAAIESKFSLTVITLTTFVFGFSICSWLSYLRRREYSRARALERSNAELEEARAGLARSSQTKSIFVANVSHELRTPLNAVIGFSDMLERETFGPLGHAKYKEYIIDIRRSGRHLLELINDLLDLNRIESGKQVMKPEWVSLAEVAPDWILMVREMARARGQKLVVPEPMPDHKLWVDVRALHQIMVNLLTNACKYAGDGCRIKLDFHEWADGALRIGVADNGVGMDAETVTRVLQPFEMAVNHTSIAREGWGMGVPLARSLAEANGLIPRVKSRLGEGSLFSVQFPPHLVRRPAEDTETVTPPARIARA